MIIPLFVFTLVCVGSVTALILINRALAERAADAKRELERMRLHYESEATRVFSEAAAGVNESQKMLDQQYEDLKRESARVRQHYLDEARKIQIAANAMVAKVLKETQPLRKFQNLRDAEVDVERRLSYALNEATSLTAEANALLADARIKASEERATGIRKAREIHEQAGARLDQAIRDSGQMIAAAEKRAHEIGGDAYVALQEKRMLEQAAQAMRNIVEGYGDRYLVPTHSLLDDLAAEYGYDAAGQSLASAREQSRRMVEQGQAAACEYADSSRRATAIQFVIHAFNGSIDAILTRTKSDNLGLLEQKIRDVYSIVNLDGSAFRNARILPAYLDARLAELKWAVVVQELAMRDREEQRYQKERERDLQKAEEERLRQLREIEKEKEQAAKEQEIKRAALAEAESRLAVARSEERAKMEEEVERLRQELGDVNQKLEDATQRVLTIAQLTRKGRIYIISNIGSFGEGVYKIGMTRRAAEERVDELCSASVPFEFDIHGVIETNDALALEYKIHHHFLPLRVNKINLRKEFFRVTLKDIRSCVDSLELGKDLLNAVTWTERATAQQYYDSLNIERDAAAREKWLQRTKLLAERRQRDVRTVAAPGDAEETEPPIFQEAPTLP